MHVQTRKRTQYYDRLSADAGAVSKSYGGSSGAGGGGGLRSFPNLNASHQPPPHGGRHRAKTVQGLAGGGGGGGTGAGAGSGLAPLPRQAFGAGGGGGGGSAADGGDPLLSDPLLAVSGRLMGAVRGAVCFGGGGGHGEPWFVADTCDVGPVLPGCWACLHAARACPVAAPLHDCGCISELPALCLCLCTSRAGALGVRRWVAVAAAVC